MTSCPSYLPAFSIVIVVMARFSVISSNEQFSRDEASIISRNYSPIGESFSARQVQDQGSGGEHSVGGILTQRKFPCNSDDFVSQDSFLKMVNTPVELQPWVGLGRRLLEPCMPQPQPRSEISWPSHLPAFLIMLVVMLSCSVKTLKLHLSREVPTLIAAQPVTG